MELESNISITDSSNSIAISSTNIFQSTISWQSEIDKLADRLLDESLFMQVDQQATISNLISYANNSNNNNSNDNRYTATAICNEYLHYGQYSTNSWAGTTITVSDGRNTTWWGTPAKPKTSQQKLHEIIESRMAPAIIISNRLSDVDRKTIRPTSDPREMRARETLQRVIGEEKYRDFLRHGFVTAHNRISGMAYQMFPGGEFTRVFKDGKMIEKLCVVLTGNFPPTDTLIVRYLMALNNEEQLWALANKFGAWTSRSTNVLAITRQMPRTMEQLAKIAA